VPFFGHLTDRYGTRRIYLCAAAFAVILAFPFYWLVGTGQTVVIWLALFLGTSIGKELNNAGQAAYLSQIFEPRIRLSGVSLARESVSALGGLLPVIGLALVSWAGGSYWPVAVLMVVLGGISFISIYLSMPFFERSARGHSGASAPPIETTVTEPTKGVPAR
jgi:MFS family permease